MFEFFFKYRPLIYERGDVVLALPWWALAVALAAVALMVPLALRYRDVGRDATTADRLLLSGLRTAALGVLVLCLFRPALLVSTVVPQRNFVAVLLDDSRSMRISDLDAAPRASRVLEWFGGDPANPPDDALPQDSFAEVAAPVAADGGALRKRLEEKFRVRMYGFSTEARRLENARSLGFAGERTDLAAALGRAQQELAGLPLSGIVLVTDGADNSDGPLTDALLELEAAALPVYTVGLGRERISPDIEVRRVAVPRSVLRGSTIVADVVIANAGFEGRTVRVDVEDSGRILGSHQVELSAEVESPVQVQFTVEETGPRRLSFRVRPEEGEAVTGNNVRETILDVRNDREKILYFEGELRFETGFLRRAVAADPNIQVVALVRTADEKFQRLGVDDADELAAGFPRTREELFEYSGLVLGSVEASFFTHDQLQMMADFVSQRGGGLLALGGRRAFAEGGYAGTSLADALPVVLESVQPGETPVREATVEVTPAGRLLSALRIEVGESESADRWSALPAITQLNRIAGIKPGAVTLLAGTPADGSDRTVLLAHQRFGRGTAIALPIQDTWLWQMHADIDLEDQTHETFWRQMLRWLVADVPDRARVTPSEDLINPGEQITLTAELEDERYLRVNGARVATRVTSPTGVQTLLPMDWTVDRDGEYETQFRPDENGLYTVRVELEGDSAEASGAPGSASFFRVGSAAREQFEAGLREPLLRRISEETGGRYYSADDVSTLPDDMRYTESGNTMVETRPLWDMPFLFMLLIGLVSAEWAYRRWRGLA